MSGKIPYTTASGGTGNILLREVKLLAGEIKLLDMTATIKRGRIGDIESAGLQVNYSTEPGSVILSCLSTSRSRNHVFHVPVIDPVSQHSSAGTYPWSITEDSSTVIYIKNVTSRPQQYFLQLNFEGNEQAPEGGIYQPRLKTVEPDQTVALDLIKLRDNKVPDAEGRLIAQDSRRGQVHWSVRLGENKSLIGRAEEVSLSKRFAISFTSEACCPDSYESSSITPASATKLINGTEQFTATVRYRDCGGNAWDNLVNGPWVSSQASVATVNQQSGLATPLSPGTTNIEVTTTDSRFIAGSCQQVFVTHTIAAAFQVIKIIIKKGTTDITNTTRDVIVGQEIALSTEVQPAGTTFTNSQWTVPGIKVAGYTDISNNFSTATDITLTNLTSTSVDFYWVDGGDGRQVTYSIKINNVSYMVAATFNVKRPAATITTQTGSVQIFTDSTGLQLGYGQDTITNKGIVFTANVTVPSGFIGDRAWLQIYTPNRRRRLAGNGQWQTLTGAGLDGGFPYLNSTGLTTADSPVTNLSSAYLEKTVNDTGEMYLMFKPFGTGAGEIWVPLRKVTWSWAADVVSSGSSWSFVTTPSNTQSPMGVDVTTHPKWTGPANANNWQ